MEAPLRVTRMALRRDSGGAGTHRGGLGLVKEFEVLETETTLTHRGERHFCPAAGSQGGLPGAPAYSVIRRAAGTDEVVPSKQVTLLRPGDRLIVETAGGGGYGDPRQRDPSLVRADIANGKVSREAAARDYGIVIN
jgi:N-methylhydantoinase B